MRTLINKLSESKQAKTAAWASLLFFPLFLILGAELLQYEQKKYVISLIFNNPLSILFGYIPLLMLFAALIAIFRRPAAAGFILGFFILVMAVVSRMKYDIVGEYLYPWDFLMLKNGAEFRQFDIKFELKAYMVIVFSVWLIWCLFLRSTKIKVSLSAWMCVALAVSAALCLRLYVYNDNFRKLRYSDFGVEVTDVTNQQENYKKHGFVSGFVLNLGNKAMSKPVMYGKDEVEYILKTYEKRNKPFTVKPDIVIILSEAFWDIRLLPGNNFTKNPLQNFDRIKSEQVAGNFIAPTHGGGTVRTEFEILTGIAYDNFQTGIVPYSGSVLKDTWSYANHLKSLGYKTSAVHTYAKTFYNRNGAFPLLGIDRFVGEEDLKNPPRKGPYITDDYFADLIINELNRAEGEGAPAFIFGISMENHGLYDNKYSEKEFDIGVSNPKLSSSELNIVRNYTQGVYDEDKMLGKIYDFVKTRKRPTAVLYFGDHQPSIGYDFSAYKHTGFLPKGTSGIPFKYLEKMHTCQYAIFKNYDTEKQYKYSDASVSGYLLTALFMGYIDVPENAYMNFLVDYANSVPKNIPSKGIVSPGVDKKIADSYFRVHSLISFDILNGRYLDMGVKFK